MVALGVAKFLDQFGLQKVWGFAGWRLVRTKTAGSRGGDKIRIYFPRQADFH